MLEFVPPRVQNSALLLSELHGVLIHPFLQTLQVPPDVIVTFQLITHSLYFHAINKNLTEGTFCPIVEIIKQDIKKDWTQY